MSYENSKNFNLTTIVLIQMRFNSLFKHTTEHEEENDEIAPTQTQATQSTQSTQKQGGSKKKSKGRKKPAYAGGLVLEPKKGLFSNLCTV